jgi:hypothetical protein
MLLVRWMAQGSQQRGRLAQHCLTAVAHTCDLEASREQHLGWAGCKLGCAPVKAKGFLSIGVSPIT